MNAAFLLVTTAWLTGAQAEAPKPAAAAPAAPATAAPIVSMPMATAGGCCGGAAPAASSCGCNDCCEKPSLCERIKARFHKNDCGCEAPKASHFHHKSECDCGCEKGPGLMDRVKGLFHHAKDCGCDTGCGGGCSSCGGGMAPGAIMAPGTIAPKSEAIPVAPKTGTENKMPSGAAPAGKQVQAIPQTSSPPILEVAPAKSESPF